MSLKHSLYVSMSLAWSNGPVFDSISIKWPIVIHCLDWVNIKDPEYILYSHKTQIYSDAF